MTRTEAQALDCEHARAYAYSLGQHLALSPPLNPTAIVVTDEDSYWASAIGIHSLAVAERYGHHKVTCVSLPINKLLSEFLSESGGNPVKAEWNRGDRTVSWHIGARVLIYDYCRSGKRPGDKRCWSVVPAAEG